MTALFDDRPIRRVQIGTERPPARSPTEEQAQRLADRAATESRLKNAEALWRTVQQAASGGAAPMQSAETGVIWDPDDLIF